MTTHKTIASIAVMAALTALSGATSAAQLDTSQHSTSDAIRPFHIHVPEAELVDLKRRIAATRLPEKETVADPSQGVDT